MELSYFQWSPRFGEDDHQYGEDYNGPAIPCAATPARDATVPVRSWLVDSGSPLDIIDKSRVKAFKCHIRRSDPVVLDTANGELKADREIPLHVGRLGEDIAPLVLPSTPDVLSLGRRVVEHGYSFWWPGYSSEPELTHPVTGEVVQLRVEDYCPYLDDDDTTIAGSNSSATAVRQRPLPVVPVAGGNHSNCANFFNACHKPYIQQHKHHFR